MDNINIFINKILPGAVLARKKYKVNLCLTLAQAILESNWGKSKLSIKANNLFGIKWSNGCGYDKYLIKTREYINEKWIIENAYFRKYKSWNESIVDHGKFLTKDRYKKVIDNVYNYKKACYEVWKANYATDPKYPDKLINIIEKYNLNKLKENFE